MKLDFDDISFLIHSAFEEDLKDGDITSNNIIPLGKEGKASMRAKEDGVIAGLEVVNEVFNYHDEDINYKPLVDEGQWVKKGDIIAVMYGPYRSLLIAERIALNFLQRMSGIATETHKYVAETKGTKAKILDTRKTLPAFRHLDKYSVFAGGGTNHRIGLYDMVMIKDNHIKMAGSITKAVEQVRLHIPNSIKIEVETTTFEEVEEAVASDVDIIMLDNMDNNLTRKCVEFINGRAKVEASGNMTLDRIASVAETGVDFISVGAITHSVKALDISMNFVG
ncbi:carboxylating nicotinate-nucleotide diphosphorylase [Halosquirtibacter xylanolyticus]|uniref:carboxylating nicotinate-nucleotide diphosphorylase n=1 Tax=Halosquirtibacter xylanolyticus TaxID=3374599 RepID=UPI00374A1D37|nr:carboxylating nicotinate-nucleotide diphosphorylase [Prolixibacteraceae bacterium]